MTERTKSSLCTTLRSKPSAELLIFATQGAGGNDEDRLRVLTRNFPVQSIPFDPRAKSSMFLRILKKVRADRPSMVLMEGTGIAGGIAVLLGRLLFSVPYVVSSGDAVAPFLGCRMPWLKPAFIVYEHLLYRWSSGFIGWTPYLVGRALSFGAPHAMTAAGWASVTTGPEERALARARLRKHLGIPDQALVIGIAGSLAWNQRVHYCYGHELVRALQLAKRADAFALIVGDGDGKARLAAEAGAMLNRRILLVGRVPRQEIPNYLATMDIASLPQSTDQVGSFRYTAKISEYLAAGLPVISGQIPLAYDLDQGWLWRLPGSSPWSHDYVESLAVLIDQLSPAEIVTKKRAIPSANIEFDRELQVARTTAFLADLLANRRRQTKNYG